MSASPSPARRPNILWIFGDQHRAHATGYAGDPNVCTPNLDRLAAEGVNCRAAVSGFPLCCPARGALLTGLYPHRCVPGHQFALPPEQRTIGHVMAGAGYHTGYFGKWHLGGFQESQGRAAFFITDPKLRGGFHEWIGYENNNAQYDCWVHGGEGPAAKHYRLPGYETDALTDLMIDFLRRRSSQRDQPFFGVLSVQPPHDPYVAPESWMQRHTGGRLALRTNVPAVPRLVERARRELAGYYAAIENLDWNVGRVRAALAELGLAEDTLILFFSDHGDLHGSHGQFMKTAPWEEAIRVPLIIGGGSNYDRATRIHDAPVNMADIAPTTLGLCGVPVPAWMQGEDFSGVRTKGRAVPAAESAFLQCVVPTGHLDSVDRPWRGVVTRDGWKYVALEQQPWLLFNLNEDPFEQANHAFNSRYAAERKRLQSLLAGWIDKTGDAFPLPAV
jgi:arylsulfatase A-like enzyme